MKKKGREQTMWYGMRLQALREHSGLTRDDLSLRTGISPSTLAKIEAGLSVPSIEMLIRLANSFKVRLPKLLLEVGVIMKEDTRVALAEGPVQGLPAHRGKSRN
jgi:transcriptional regulator with XRE-family HTH domain